MAKLSDDQIRKRVQRLFKTYKDERSLGDLAREAEAFCKKYGLTHGMSKAYLQQMYAGTAPTRPSFPKLIVMNRVFGWPWAEIIRAYLGDDLVEGDVDLKASEGGLTAAQAKAVRDSLDEAQSAIQTSIKAFEAES